MEANRGELGRKACKSVKKEQQSRKMPALVVGRNPNGKSRFNPCSRNSKASWRLIFTQPTMPPVPSAEVLDSPYPGSKRKIQLVAPTHLGNTPYNI